MYAMAGSGVAGWTPWSLRDVGFRQSSYANATVRVRCKKRGDA